jgi:predicted nucleic acid-binding protein
MPLVLDTTVLIDALRGRPATDRIEELTAEGELLLTTAINVEEVGGRLATADIKDFPMPELTVVEWPVGR